MYKIEWCNCDVIAKLVLGCF